MGVLGGDLTLAGFDFLLAVVGLDEAGAFSGQTPQHWPQFRGPNRDGKSLETGLLKQWPENGPKLLRTISGFGSGFASRIVIAFPARGAICVALVPREVGNSLTMPTKLMMSPASTLRKPSLFNWLVSARLARSSMPPH